MGDDTGARMGKGQNEGGFSEEQLQMYKDCFKLMDINKDGQLDKNDLRGAFDNVGVLVSSLSSTACWARSLDPAPMTTWSRCSRRRWPARATTPTTSSSRPSRLRQRGQDRLQDVRARPQDLGRQDDQGRDRRHLR